jgi:hypothetical protein
MQTQITAIDAKDAILSQLNDVSADPTEFHATATRILDALELTLGLWNELSYAYKAAEIAKRIYSECTDLRCSDHHARRVKFDTLAMRAYTVEMNAEALQWA